MIRRRGFRLFFNVFLIFFLSLQARAEELSCVVESNLLPKEINKFAQLFTQEPLKFTLDVDGSFLLQLNIEFPPEMTPANVLQKFTDPKTVISNSNLIKELVYEENSKIQTLQACARPEVVTSKSCKSLACAETKSLCSYPVINSNLAEYHCKVDTSHKPTGDLFDSGSTHYTCIKTAVSTSCTFVFEGKPKPLNSVFMKRTSRQLALGGAVETALLHLRIALPLAQDKSLISKTLLKAKNDFYAAGTTLIRVKQTKTININYK